MITKRYEELNTTKHHILFSNQFALAYILLLALTIVPSWSYAQTCGCDFTIPPSTTQGIITWDGGPTGHNVQPGQTICFQAGTYFNTIRIKNVKGTATSRITIKNCGGQTIIDNVNDGRAENYSALDITGSEYFILTGDGAPNVPYGIKIAGSEIHGLSIAGYSTDFEVKHLEIANTDGCGINAKTDPSCSNPDIRWFTQKNSIFHDNYLHHIGLEGFYVGYTHYPEHHNRCGTSGTILRAGAQENIKIYNNRLEYIAWDAIQIGAFTTGNAIYGNVIREYGTERYSAHIHAIQLSDNSDQCDVYDNQIMPISSTYAGEGHAIASWAERVKFYNNLVVKTERHAIQMYDEADGDGYYHIMNNTVIDPGAGVLEIFGNAPDIRVNNNIFIQPQAEYISAIPSYAVVSNNYQATSTAGSGLSSDYHLTSSSPSTILNAGLNLYAYGVTKDFDDQARPSSGPFDIGADEFIPLTKVVKVNFRGTEPAFSDPAWNDWNAMPTTTSPAPTFTNLKYTDGSSSNYNLVITTRFSGANGLGMTGTGVYPSQVMQTNWYVHNNTPTPGVFNVTGLNNSKTYTFRFFGSREDPTGTTNRATDYTIGSTTVTLNASNNTTQTVEIPNVSPVNGVITVTVKYGTGATFGYLNAMEIFENSGTSAAAVEQPEVLSSAPEVAETVAAHPVPFDDKITITVKEKIRGEVKISFIGLDGRTFFEKAGYDFSEGGVVELEVGEANIPRGVNVLQIQSDQGFRRAMRVMKK
jgi:hypothetical protein